MTQLSQGSSLPRGVCPACGRQVALRRAGQLREHTHSGRANDEKCAGAGYTPAQDMSPEQSSVPLVRSRAGHPKPLSPAQAKALAAISDDQVFCIGDVGHLYGCRADVYEVLERNRLVEVLDEPENPERPAHRQRYRIILNSAGAAVLRRWEESRS